MENQTEIIRTPFGQSAPEEKVIGFLDSTLRPSSSFSIRQEYPALFDALPGGESLTIEVGNQIVSHAAFLVREFVNPLFRLRVGLIGSVTTLPEYRGRGMAKTILSEITDILRERGCHLAILWSDKPDFYVPLGFHRSGREVDIRFTPQTVGVPRATVRPYEASTDAHFLWRLYQKHDTRLDRSLEEQKSLCRIPRTQVYVGLDEGKIHSYVAIHKGMDFTNYIHEWGGRPVDVAKTVAWVQKHEFPDNRLTLISPSHYDLAPLEAIGEMKWRGALGLIKLLDKVKVFHYYSEYLRSQGITSRYSSHLQEIEVEGKVIPMKNEKESLKLVFGDEDSASLPTLPFFLWGFDSV